VLNLAASEVWFVTGSQHLYGPETLALVAEHSQQSAAALLADSSATSVALQSGTGRLVVGTDGEAVLVLNDLPPAPTGKTYQAWIVDDQMPVSAGTFASAGDQAVVPIPQAVPDGAVVAVTIEESGGATSPTLPPLAASEPV